MIRRALTLLVNDRLHSLPVQTVKQELERYLNDHLAGATGALLVIEHIVSSMEKPEARDFFTGLKDDVQADREFLEEILLSADLEVSNTSKVMGGVTARVGLFKLMWEGLEPGKLGMFEALEMLALGVQGKRLLWLALEEIAPYYPQWSGHDFSDLERQAIEQRDGIEQWRLEAARASLTPSRS